jgi:hypothetical protein
MKINKLLAASSIAALAVVSTAVAQDKSTTAPAQTTAAATEKMDLKGTWRSSKLIGLDIYNRADEKIGDINEILLDKDGKVKAVVIGVGGFLGMGEHDVAVSMDKLKFMEESHRSAQARTDAKTDAKTDNRATTGSSTAPARRDTTTANDWMPDHAVMDATKDQLKALPQFKYSSYN